jgi:hypothetical protein
MTLEAERAAILLEALGLLVENEEDVALRVRARLLLAELEPVADFYRKTNGGTGPQTPLHPSLVASVLPSAVDDKGRVTSRDALEGAMDVLRWLTR